MTSVKTFPRQATVTVQGCSDHVCRAVGHEQTASLRTFVRTILDYIGDGTFGQQADGVYRPGHWFSPIDTQIILEVATYVSSFEWLDQDMTERLKDVYRSGLTIV